jgi:hypothetical protein
VARSQGSAIAAANALLRPVCGFHCSWCFLRFNLILLVHRGYERHCGLSVLAPDVPGHTC